MKVIPNMQMKHRKGEENTEQEEEERTISVISNLFQGLSRGSRRDRVAAKFVENEFEKCDRLMELYNRYKLKVVAQQVRTPLSSLTMSTVTRAKNSSLKWHAW